MTTVTGTAYLRHLLAEMDTRPSSVAVVGRGAPWMTRQVTAEMRDLLPDSGLAPVAEADLIVVAAAPEHLVALTVDASRVCRDEATVWVYDVRAGRAAPVRAGEVTRWARDRRRAARALRAARRRPGMWTRAGRLVIWALAMPPILPRRWLGAAPINGRSTGRYRRDT